MDGYTAKKVLSLKLQAASGVRSKKPINIVIGFYKTIITRSTHEVLSFLTEKQFLLGQHHSAQAYKELYLSVFLA